MILSILKDKQSKRYKDKPGSMNHSNHFPENGARKLVETYGGTQR
jgi:hypothetical protein